MESRREGSSFQPWWYLRTVQSSSSKLAPATPLKILDRVYSKNWADIVKTWGLDSEIALIIQSKGGFYRSIYPIPLHRSIPRK